MEPSKNTNFNTGTNGAGSMSNDSTEPAFRGMPKPGQPLAPTPRVTSDSHPTFAQVMASKGGVHDVVTNAHASEVPMPRPAAVVPSNLPGSPVSSVPMSSASPAPRAMPSASASPFSAHSPSALDRLMNPSLDKAPATPAPLAPVPMSAPSFTAAKPAAPVVPTPPASAPAASAFKPYTPPASVAAAASAAPTMSSYSAPKPASPSPAQSPISATHTTSTPPVSNTYTGGVYAQAVPPAPSASNTAAKLKRDVSAMLAAHQTPVKKGGSGLGLTLGLIVLLLLLGGGGYYWYQYMYLPSQASVLENMQDQTSQPTNTSSFPTSATKPVTSAPNTGVKPTAPAATAPTKPVAPTRVVTPFTQAQRQRVTSFIVANINNLVTKGGPYEVTDVTFDGPDRAVVQYTDGTYSYTGIAVASIDTANNVRIVSFSVLEK